MADSQGISDLSLQVVIIAFQLFTAAIVLVEIGLHLAGRRHDYRFGDVVANLCTAIIYGALGSLAIGGLYLVYETLRAQAGLFEIDTGNVWAWVLGFFCADFCHYWFHRAAHRNNFLWGIHQGHHSSEDFNLSIAIRKGIFQQWVDWPFFLPMALLGFPFFEMYLPLKGAQFAYQFWIHNQFIGKLGPIENVLVTPSLHRVHHAQNAPYIDKNYAGVLILWDKLFGSYAEEREPVVYGITTQVRTFNPLRMQFVYWQNLWQDAVASANKWDRVRIWFMPTGWRPSNRRHADWPHKIKDIHTFSKYDPPIGGRAKGYVLLQFATLMLLMGWLGTGETGGAVVLAALIGVLWTAWSIGALLDRGHGARTLEFGRVVALGGAAAASFALPPDALPAPALPVLLLALSAASLLYLTLAEPWQPVAADAAPGPVDTDLLAAAGKD